MSVILIDPDDVPIIPIDWADVLPTGVALSTVVHTVPSPLTLDSEGASVANGTSWAKISGQEHGGTYLLQAEATLDNGETINRAVTLRCGDA